jgi:Flp pilus assembly protein TadD
VNFVLQNVAALGHPRSVVPTWVLSALCLSFRIGVACAIVAPVMARAHVGVDELADHVHAEAARDPANPEGHLNRARVSEMRGDYDAAMAALDDATDVGADAAVVGAARGKLYLAAGFPRSAKRAFDRVLVMRPDAHGTRYDRGRAWLAIGDAQSATDDMSAAIAGLARPTPEQVLALKDAWLVLGKKAEALRALDDGMGRVGSVVSLQVPAIALEVELERWAGALTRVDDLARQAPADPTWPARRGDILEQAGRSAEARAAYAQALSLIRSRPARRARAFDDLKRRLETVLASATQGGTQP